MHGKIIQISVNQTQIVALTDNNEIWIYTGMSPNPEDNTWSKVALPEKIQ